ncbi:unnamed protein product [Bubo scandiacus]
MNYTQIRHTIENAAVSGDETCKRLLCKANSYTMEWDNNHWDMDRRCILVYGLAGVLCPPFHTERMMVTDPLYQEDGWIAHNLDLRPDTVNQKG